MDCKSSSCNVYVLVILIFAFCLQSVVMGVVSWARPAQTLAAPQAVSLTARFNKRSAQSVLTSGARSSLALAQEAADRVVFVIVPTAIWVMPAIFAALALFACVQTGRASSCRARSPLVMTE